MKLTARGRRLLKAALPSAMPDAASWDLESAVRVIWSATQLSAEAGINAKERVAKQRDERAMELQSQALDLKACARNPISYYEWMQAFCKSQQLKAEAEAIRGVARLEKTPANPDRDIPDSLRKIEPRLG